MDQARDDLFPDTGLSGNEHLCVGASGAVDIGFNRADGFTATDESNLGLMHRDNSRVHRGNVSVSFSGIRPRPTEEMSPGRRHRNGPIGRGQDLTVRKSAKLRLDGSVSCCITYRTVPCPEAGDVCTIYPYVVL